MLSRPTPAQPPSALAEAAAKHVRATLHVQTDLAEWPEARALPRFLTAAYGFVRATGADTETLWLLSEEAVAPATLRKHLAQVAALWPGPAAVVFRTMPAYQRQRLVQAGIAFIVPGTQIYLPSMGIDLRDRTRKAPAERDRLRPSAQALLLWLLYAGLGATRTSTDAAEQLGFTRMTASRAIGELEAAGAIEARTVNRTRTFSLTHAPEEVWRAMADRLVSPVARRAVAPADPTLGAAAGLSALAHYTNLAEPDAPVRALTAAQAAAPEARALQVAEGCEADDMQVEIWTYDPMLLAEQNAGGGAFVDRLSLYLSLREDPDERIQQALAQMLEEAGG
jgi:DNA-binding MarR family transcriptional regulator